VIISTEPSLHHQRSTACPNCSASAPGQFCADCGQRQTSLRLSLWSLIRGHLQDAFSLEGRLFRTLGLLLTRPGLVTREYLAGRRMSYTHPLRLYLVVSAVYFTAYVLTRPTDRAFFGFSGEGDLSYASLMARGLLISVPAIALAMKLLYPRGVLLVEHLIFLFYAGAMGLLGALISLLLATLYKLLWTSVEAAPFNPGWFHLLAFAAFAVYMVASLRGAYGETLLRSLWKGVALLFLLVVLAAVLPMMLQRII